MFGNPFYYGSVRKIVSGFGTLFNGISIQRKTSAGAVSQTIKIPITYGPKQKWMVRLLADPNAGQNTQASPVQITVPRMSFEITSMSYDANRKLDTVGKTVNIRNVELNDKTYWATYNPVPWNIDFNLYIYVKHIDDGLMIIEQIVPYFTPDFTITINDMPVIAKIRDIPIILNNVSTEDNYNGNFSERRMIVWTLSFTTKAYLYPAIVEPSKVTDYEINLYADGLTDTTIDATITKDGITEP